MAGNGALDLSIRIMGKVDPSLVTAIKQTKGLTGDLANALTGTKSLGSTAANTLGVIGKTGLGIMATLTTASAVMIKKTTSMAEEYQAQAADAVKYVGGIMNDDGSIDPEKRATMEDAILKMTTQVPIKRDEMAQIAASLGQSGKSYEQIFLDNQQTGEKATCTIRPVWLLRGILMQNLRPIIWQSGKPLLIRPITRLSTLQIPSTTWAATWLPRRQKSQAW